MKPKPEVIIMGCGIAAEMRPYNSTWSSYGDDRLVDHVYIEALGSTIRLSGNLRIREYTTHEKSSILLAVRSFLARHSG